MSRHARKDLTQGAHNELEELAAKHTRWEDFRDEVLRHAEQAWQNMRRNTNGQVIQLNLRNPATDDDPEPA